jgi:hypothetical protein
MIRLQKLKQVSCVIFIPAAKHPVGISCGDCLFPSFLGRNVIFDLIRDRNADKERTGSGMTEKRKSIEWNFVAWPEIEANQANWTAVRCCALIRLSPGKAEHRILTSLTTQGVNHEVCKIWPDSGHFSVHVPDHVLRTGGEGHRQL